METELDKLEPWKMSTSHQAPAPPAVEIEAKNILKLIQEENQAGQNMFNKSISKQTFLRILIIDIILSGVYFTVNIILASHLIFSDKQNNLKYGMLMMMIPWIPAVLIIPNEIFYKTGLFEKNSKYAKLLSVFTAVVFFPIWSICLYISSFRNLTITSYLKRLEKVSSIKQILHMTLHMVLIIFLIMRGKVLQEDETSCITDELGRSVCFTFPVILSLILSVLLILVKGTRELKYLPFLTVTLVFRTVSLAFILTYIDYWSVIPFSLLFLLQIVLIEYGKKNISVIHNEKACDDTDAPCILIWNGNEWMPRTVDQDLDLGKDSSQDHKPLKTSIFLLATLNIFFSKNIFIKMNGQYMILHSISNFVLMAVISIIFCLVTFVERFHYETNILKFNSFLIITVFVIMFGVLSSIFHKYNLFQLIISQCISKYVIIFTSLIIIAAIPLALLFVYIHIGRSSKFYFFTINTKEKYTEVKTFPFQTNQKVLANLKESFQFNEIVWDNHLKSNNFTHSKLIFCNSPLFCDTFQLEDSVKILVSPTNSLRYSSPHFFGKINSLIGVNLSDLYNFSKVSGYVHYSKLKPSSETLHNLLNCSTSLSMNIIDPNLELLKDEQVCLQEKFLNLNNRVMERRCIVYESKLSVLDIQCGQTLPLEQIAFISSTKVIKKR